MALTVLVRSGDLEEPASVTFDAPRIVLGRGGGCEVLLPDPSVSQRHASIRQRGVDYVIVDEGSVNGTFVGPVRLSPHAPRLLKSGDRLRLGRVWVEVRIDQSKVTDAQLRATREIALELVASALSADGESSAARIQVRQGPDPEKTLFLTERDACYVVGRGPQSDLCLEDDDISRRHLEIARRGLNLVVTDLGSKNGTTLDGKRIEGGSETIWPRGAVLRIGQTELVYEDPARAALEAIAALPDERMHDEEPIESPLPVPARAPANAQDEESPIAHPAVIEGPSKASAPRPRRLPWLDGLVALVAVLVLGVSLLGFWWLLGH